MTDRSAVVALGPPLQPIIPAVRARPAHRSRRRDRRARLQASR
jgi:hypothetical protein